MAKPRTANFATLMAALGHEGMRELILAGKQRGLTLRAVAERLSIPVNAAKQMVGAETPKAAQYPAGTTFSRDGTLIIPCDIEANGDAVFYCPHCRKNHRHGITRRDGGAEHRLSHCFQDGSPLSGGYWLVPKLVH